MDEGFFVMALRFHVTSELGAWPAGLGGDALAYNAAHAAAALRIDMEQLRFSCSLK
jgi:hypothetical protein